MDQNELDKWLLGCINFYNKHSTKVMKTIEERISQLENAHGRLFNEQKNLIKDLSLLNEKITKELNLIFEKLKETTSTEEPGTLPDKLADGRKYVGLITEIIGSSTIFWKSRNKNYTNWQVKLQGKEHVYIAFINSDIKLEPDMLVEFIFENPFNLKHLKIYEK